MGTLFSETLCRIRNESGFPTAYRFAHSNGGARALGLTYRLYLRMEQGKSLPKFQKLYKLILALRLMPKSAPANELAIAWLKTLIGDEGCERVFPFTAAAPSAHPLSPIENAAKIALAGNKYHITPEQFQAILTDMDTYLCYTAMSKDTESWSAAALAGALGLKKDAAEKALITLCEAKILKEGKRGFYKCPLASYMVEFPQINTVDPALRAKMEKYHEELLASGMGRWERGCIVRADTAAFREFFPLMGLNVSVAQTYSITEKTDKSALFFVQGKVVKLRDF